MYPDELAKAEKEIETLKAANERLRIVLGNIAEGCSFPEDDVQRAVRDAARQALTSEGKDMHRCAVCGWMLSENPQQGCTRGNCSLRPRPETLYDKDRANKENAKIELPETLDVDGEPMTRPYWPKPTRPTAGEGKDGAK